MTQSISSNNSTVTSNTKIREFSIRKNNFKSAWDCWDKSFFGIIRCFSALDIQMPSNLFSFSSALDCELTWNKKELLIVINKVVKFFFEVIVFLG